MKRIISLIILTAFLCGISFGQTEYERKLEYKRKKIQILVRTSYVGQVSGYTTTDMFTSTYSPEATYSYTYGYGTTRTGATSMVQQVSDWIIVKGGIRELSDLEFLETTGNPTKASIVKKAMDDRNMWMWIGTGLGLVGLAGVISGATSGNSSIVTPSAIATLLGIGISTLNSPLKHYIAVDYAQEEADKYNISLKKNLGLPIDFE